jgi:CCAAT-binding transcription factor (CBF-B/NF-YA) subunit B
MWCHQHHTSHQPSAISNYCGNNPWMTMMMMMSQHQQQNNPVPMIAQPQQNQNQMMFTSTPVVMQQQQHLQPTMDHTTIVNGPIRNSMNTSSMLNPNVACLQHQQTNDSVNQSHATAPNMVDGGGPRSRTTTTMVNPPPIQVKALVPLVPPQPTYVNGKQYLRIVKRREARAKMEDLYKRPCKQGKSISSSTMHGCHLNGIRTDDDNYNSSKQSPLYQ